MQNDPPAATFLDRQQGRKLGLGFKRIYPALPFGLIVPDLRRVKCVIDDGVKQVSVRGVSEGLPWRPMGATDSPFQGAGGRLGLTVWRVENLTPVPVPPRDYGQFYDGSYRHTSQG